MWDIISITIFKYLKNIFTGSEGVPKQEQKSTEKNVSTSAVINEIEKEDSISSDSIDLMGLFNSLSEGIFVFNNYGNLITANEMANEIFKDEERIQDINDLIEYFNINISLEELVYIDSLGKRDFYVNKSGKYLKLQFIATFKGGDRAENIIVSISDHSEQKILDNRRKDFVANVSHELKTPLTSILSYAEALTDEYIDGETKNKFLNVLIDEAYRMDRLIGDLLQLSKLSSDRYALNKRRFSFSTLINNCIDKINLEAKNHNLTVNKYLFGELPEIMMDVDRMEQVILNVLSNSIKYTPEKGVITIYAGKNYNQVYVKISDNGIGIPKELTNRVFERFYRVDKARSRQQGGTGLGLAISKEIVEAHEGIITINSEFGKGTDVMIKLPIKPINSNLYY